MPWEKNTRWFSLIERDSQPIFETIRVYFKFCFAKTNNIQRKTDFRVAWWYFTYYISRYTVHTVQFINTIFSVPLSRAISCKATFRHIILHPSRRVWPSMDYEKLKYQNIDTFVLNFFEQTLKFRKLLLRTTVVTCKSKIKCKYLKVFTHKIDVLKIDRSMWN